MRCLRPIYALDVGAKNPETGARHIRILPKRADLYSFKVLEERYGAGSILSLPCGQCINCRINYSRTWALRCVCEASLYDENWFLTLTYDEAHYPGKAQKEDFQKFMKRLRKKHPGVRYFCACEKGEHTKRYHWHVILFNLHLDGIRCLGKGPKGGYYYECDEIKKLWSDNAHQSIGFYVLGDVNYTTCNYVAQYCLKKTYQNEKTDEFVTMSLKPGIGTRYFEENLKTIIRDDKIYINSGGSYVNAPPRYFDKLLARIYPQIAEDIKDERVSKANIGKLTDLIRFGLQNVEESYEIYAQDAVNKMKEKLHKRK